MLCQCTIGISAILFCLRAEGPADAYHEVIMHTNAATAKMAGLPADFHRCYPLRFGRSVDVEGAFASGGWSSDGRSAAT